jgi:bifunctional ADP-heptose synthase (sugar kinase/adenylyltransferase)
MERPVNNLQARMAVLAALECVDWVVPFSVDTPARLVEKLGPDVMVRGGDYKPNDIAGAAHVRSRGCEVIVRRATPLAARYSAAGHPRPPAPTMSAAAARSLSWPSTPNSSRRMWRE